MMKTLLMFTHFSAILWVFVIPTCPTLSFSPIQTCSHSFVLQKFLATYHSTRLLGDDYDDEEIQISYADENDSLEYKRQVGDQVEAPSRTYMGPPLFLPPGENRPSYPSTVPFTVDNVQGVLEACRQDIGTMFGYTAENRGVGITGAVDLVDIDGPILMIELSGRFWHPRNRVLQRIKTYMQTRIPELVDVLVSDESQLDDRDVVEALEDSDAY